MTQSVNKQYYLQDSRGNVGSNLMFWAPAGEGYTSNIEKAGIFSEEEAFAQHQSRHSDVPWPIDYVQERSRPVVDTQYIKHEEALAMYPDATEFYLQRAGDWDGNDILFVQVANYNLTSDLRNARIVTREDLSKNETWAKRYVAWPRPYIESKTRLAADCTRCNIKEALAPTGCTITLVPPPKAERFRCHGCGVFLSIGSYYSCSGCPRCGSDNRP